MNPTRRLIAAALSALAVGAGALGLAGPAAAHPEDMAVGRANAPVTVIAYMSVTCPHCADWHADVWPAFKAKYVDSGKVKFVLRELPTAPAEYAYGGFLVARCAGPQYFKVLDALFQGQAAMFSSDDVQTWLINAGAAGGLNADRVRACSTDEAAFNAMNARIQANVEDLPVRGTPAFFIDGQAVDQELAALSAAVDARLAGR